MPTKRLSTRDLQAFVAEKGIPFGNHVIHDDISDDWKYNDYGMRVGQPFAVWTHSDDSEPVTLTTFFEVLVERMELVAGDDPGYFRRMVSPRGLETLTAAIKRHAAKNQQARILTALARALKTARA